MPKLQNVTNANLKALLDTAGDCQMDANDIADRIEKGYCDNVPNPAELARGFLAISRAFADVAHKLLVKAALQEQKAELETMLRHKKG
jgi:hypothetical protein